MQLNQVNIGYDPGQDRLLLRMSTSADVEYRLWLTRRVTKGLWPGLMQLVASSESVRRQAEPEAKQAVIDPFVDFTSLDVVGVVVPRNTDGDRVVINGAGGDR